MGIQWDTQNETGSFSICISVQPESVEHVTMIDQPSNVKAALTNSWSFFLFFPSFLATWWSRTSFRQLYQHFLELVLTLPVSVVSVFSMQLTTDFESLPHSSLPKTCGSGLPCWRSYWRFETRWLILIPKAKKYGMTSNVSDQKYVDQRTWIADSL